MSSDGFATDIDAMDRTSDARQADEAEIDEARVRDALDRLIASDDLKASPQLAAFLRFIVQERLAGRSETIKGYTIATAALGRDPSFDPQSDPIVRVEATRLRRALERYYGGAGRQDPVVISVLKGSYVPQFTERPEPQPVAIERPDASQPAAQPRATPIPAAAPPFGAQSRLRLPILATLVLATMVGAFFVGRHQGQKEEAAIAVLEEREEGVRNAERQGLQDLPVIRIEPFVELGELVDGPASARGINLRLRDALARFDEVTVLSEPAPRPAAAGLAVPEPDGVDHSGAGAYMVSGWIEGRKDGRFTLSVALAAAADGRVIWTRQFDDIEPSPDPGRTETQLVREIATTIGQPYGVLLSDIRNRTLDKGKPLTRLGCLLLAYEYWQTHMPKDHLAARDCLEAEAAKEPPSALVLAHLSFIEVEGYRTDFNPRPGVDPLDRALAAAQQAIRLKPESARALESLMSVLSSRQEFPAAIAAGEASMRANPYDSDIVANLGARKIAVGDVDAGMALIEEATLYNAARPPWYEFALFVGALVKGDLDAVHRHAALIRPGDYPFSLLARTIDAAEHGDTATAEALAKRLVEVQPRFGSDPRAVLMHYGAVPGVIDRLVDGLAKAGIKPDVTGAN